MINKIPIKDLKNYLNKEVIIAGFVQTIRDHGNLKFLLIRDRTGTVQVVITKDNQNFEIAKKIITESVVKIQGIVKEEKQAPNGFEINPIEIEILSLANGELPIPIVSEKGAEEVDQTKRLDWRFLDLRNPRNLKIFQVWTELEKGFRNYFNQNGFIQIYTPSLMSTSSEGGSEVFEVKYFDRKAYLAQSPQFYKQMAMSAGFEKVFTFGPVFRAEPSFTSRHLTEFTGWDFEISYIDSHFDVMAVEEDLIISGFKALKESLDLNIEIPQKPFPYHTLKETKEILKKEGVVSEKEDLTPEEERKIWEITKQKTGSDFIWITDFPISVRPFYHQRYEDNPQITKSFDLIYKGVEITTGSQREHRIEILEKQAIEKGVKLETISDYLNFFRYGSPPHGGVGIGPARLIMKILDLLNVKEATYLPRDVKRLTP
ncbi:MAG TPA: aspartate--tRNA(Asn) ligase [Candidatus Paceibacterota bacterium]|nr:aspartate--tRNA(Asn) ligase [Candidatus Paceibacterota bacterium]